MRASFAEICFVAFVAVVIIQFFYFFFFYLKFIFFRNTFPSQLVQQNVSIVVCAKNEIENLKNLIPVLLSQKYNSPFEIVIVNDNSTDGTNELLEKFKNNYPEKIKIVFVEEKEKIISGKKIPLSKGIENASHPIVLLIDADCLPNGNLWLQTMMNVYCNSNTEIVLGYGAYNKCDGWLNKIIRYETFYTALQYFSFSLCGYTYMGVGRNLMYSKKLFLNNNGFKNILQTPSGDDDLFIAQVANKHNTAICIDKNSFTYSQPKTTWRSWLRQKERHYTTANFYSFKIKFLLGLNSVSQFLIIPLFIALLFSCFVKYALVVFLMYVLALFIIYKPAMQKLGEQDLWFYTPLIILWQFVYYCIFAFSIFKKPRKQWS